MELNGKGINPKINKYHEIKEEALEHMHHLFGEKVEDDWDDVHEHLAYAMKHGTCKEAAKAIMLASKWVWGHCEINETE